jgi:hypothetical protein
LPISHIHCRTTLRVWGVGIAATPGFFRHRQGFVADINEGLLRYRFHRASKRGIPGGKGQMSSAQSRSTALSAGTSFPMGKRRLLKWGRGEGNSGEILQSSFR